MNVTIKDVARAANVSVATVSRALNGHHNVAEAVRQRVIRVASELRYSPHAAARSLSSRRTHTIGVVLPDLYGEFFSELMRGVDQVARERGFHLLVSSYHGNPEEQGAALRAMRGRVDGLLLMSPCIGDTGHLTDNLSPTQPTVLMNTHLPDSGLTALSVDNYGGAVAMLRHLVDSGYRRIAFIAGPDDNFDARERQRGYVDALRQLLPGTAPWIQSGDFDEASGHAAGLALVGAGQRPDAVFAANDMMALGCLSAFQQSGIQVPRQVALAGFDDIPLSRYAQPSLTTVRVNIAKLGGQAMSVLSDAIAADVATPTSVSLQPELIVRDSTGAGRARELAGDT